MKSGMGGLVALALSIPFVLSIPPIVGWWIGSHLDQALDTAPYLMYGLLALGVIAGGKEAYRIIKMINDELKNEGD